MDDTTLTALVGLSGALIGALAAIGAQTLNNRHQEQAERRRELRDLIARFWADTDQVWRASQGVEVATMQIQSAAGEGSLSEEFREAHERLRRENADRHNECEIDALRLLAELRIFYPALAEPASLVLARSRSFEHHKRREQREARSVAVRDFEEAASKLAEAR